MNIFCKYGTFVHELATMAQEVERRLGKAEVGGSIPLGGSSMMNNVTQLTGVQNG